MHLLQTLCFRLIADFSVAVIHGRSQSSHIMTLLGIYREKIFLHVDVNNSVMSSMSDPGKIVGQLAFSIADFIWSFLALASYQSFHLKDGGGGTEILIFPWMI